MGTEIYFLIRLLSLQKSKSLSFL